uniref:Uncharacterized protein n=1 Tax=Oryza punctata TaxID=4537 RepID=A0A0E0KRR2_ORYPU
MQQLLYDKKGVQVQLGCPDREREELDRESMCKLKFNRERVGCYLLVILVIALLIGVLFGLGVFRHGYDRFKDLGRNHTCYDCNTG